MSRLVVIYKCMRWHVPWTPLMIPPSWGWETYGGLHYDHSYFNFKVEYIGPPSRHEEMKSLLRNYYADRMNEGKIGGFIVRQDLIGVEQENEYSPHTL
jgi:hypothetical protein